MGRARCLKCSLDTIVAMAGGVYTVTDLKEKILNSNIRDNVNALLKLLSIKVFTEELHDPEMHSKFIDLYFNPKLCNCKFHYELSEVEKEMLDAGYSSCWEAIKMHSKYETIKQNEELLNSIFSA